jgi:2,4'-dihydroxyacetophenone dioxygenase
MHSAISEALDKTLHISSQDVPWVSYMEGLENRILHARPSESLIVSQTRFQPNARAGLHKHTGPVFAYTIKGQWSHDPRDFIYKPGTYVYEAIDVFHAFFNGPEVSEVLFINHGGVEFKPENGEKVGRRLDSASILRTYFERCEKAGLPRPNILE